MTRTLTERARAVLGTANAVAKAEASREAARSWREGGAEAAGAPGAPDRPARPAKPDLVSPHAMPRRRAGGSAANRIALLHALAHIELNAIDLAWDIVARFAEPALPRAFYDEWATVADEEAKHFLLLHDRLGALGTAYGDLPAHDGLWQAAEATRHDLLARLAVVPLVLEARGLDVTPGMIARLEKFGDAESAAALRTIYADEIKHVATGRRWFEWLCARRGLDPVPAWRDLVARHFRGRLKPPFNDAARDEAGFGARYYGP